MTFFNSGTITANKPFDEAARNAIKKVFGDTDFECLTVDEHTICFNGYPGGCIDMGIDELVDLLSEMNIQIEGRIDYDGSYEGAYFWNYGEHHQEKTQAEVAIIDASTSELVEELERRGYRCELFQEPMSEQRGMEMIQM